jgi:hypothetical protein
MRIDEIQLSGSLFVTSSASIILGQTKISSDNNGSISFTNVSNPTQKVIGSYSGSFTGSIKLPTVPQGAAETNILLINGSGNVVYRNNLSLTGAQGSQGPSGIVSGVNKILFGTYTGAQTATVTFDSSFSSVPTVVATVVAPGVLAITITSISTTSFTYTRQSTSTWPITWIAIN